MVTGRIEAGSVKVGAEVEIVGLETSSKKSVVTGVEMFRWVLFPRPRNLASIDDVLRWVDDAHEAGGKVHEAGREGSGCSPVLC